MKSIIALITVFGLSAQAVETKEFDAKTISSVEVTNSAGDIKIVGTDSGKASVSAEKKKFGDSCVLEITQDKAVLHVKVEQKKTFTLQSCQVDLSLTLPRLVNIVVKNGAGDINIEGTKGSLDYAIGTGDVTIDAQLQSLEGKSGTGDATIKGIAGNASINTGTGDVDVTYATVPTSGELEVKNGVGDTRIFLPPAARLKAITDSGVGSVTNELANTPDAKFKVSLKSGVGDVSIKKIQ